MATPKGNREVKPMKGIGAWIDSVTDNEELSPVAPHSVTEVPIKSIQLSKSQPRRYFDSDKLDQLANSIKEHGILEPLLVRPAGNDKYELIAGERRLKSARLAKLKTVPISIQDVDDLTASQIALMENLQREDLNPVEETEGILQLLALKLGVSEAKIRSLLHQSASAKSRNLELQDNVILQMETIEKTLVQIGRFNTESFRSNRLPLLNLPDDILVELRKGNIQYTKARAIARLISHDQRTALLEKAINEKLSLKAIKEEICLLLQDEGNKKTKVEEKFSYRLQLVVKKLKTAEVWRDKSKRKQAENLLKELESLSES